VQSGTQTYRLAPECPCADATHRAELCKHSLAVELHRRALALLDSTTLAPASSPTAVATPMLQRLKLLKDLLGLYLSRRQAMALLERIQASNLSDHDRNRVNQILRAMLRLPDASLQEPSSLEAPLPQGKSKRQRH